MSLYHVGKQLTKEEAEQFNKDIGKWAGKSGSGCVGSRACEKCYVILSGTCMCMNIYTCPKCGFEKKLVSDFNKIKFEMLTYPIKFEPYILQNSV